MLRASRPLAALLAAATLAFPAAADARVVSASFEARLVVVASCSVSIERGARVDVDCANAATPYQLSSSSNIGTGNLAAQSLRIAVSDAQRITVYF